MSVGVRGLCVLTVVLALVVTRAIAAPPPTTWANTRDGRILDVPVTDPWYMNRASQTKYTGEELSSGAANSEIATAAATATAAAAAARSLKRTEKIGAADETDASFLQINHRTRKSQSKRRTSKAKPKRQGKGKASLSRARRMRAAVTAARSAPAVGWQPATVPGTVLSNLVANGHFPHSPYDDTNLLDIPDISSIGADYYTYWFVVNVTLPLPPPLPVGVQRPVVYTISFRGIGYSIDVYSNGVRLQHIAQRTDSPVTASGYFCRFQYDVTKYASAYSYSYHLQSWYIHHRY